MAENKSRLDDMNETASEHQYHQVILKNIKHDLINPINAIIGYSELILDTLDKADDRILEGDIQSIYRSSTAILSTIQKLFSGKTPTGDEIASVIFSEDLHYSIRTPLSSVIGLSELIIEDRTIVSDLDMQDSVSKINQAGKRLLKLINDLSKYQDLSNGDLIESYYTDLYLKESSIRNFQFNTQVKIPCKNGTILEEFFLDFEKIQRIYKSRIFNTGYALNILHDDLLGLSTTAWDYIYNFSDKKLSLYITSFISLLKSVLFLI